MKAIIELQNKIISDPNAGENLRFIQFLKIKNELISKLYYDQSRDPRLKYKDREPTVTLTWPETGKKLEFKTSLIQSPIIEESTNEEDRKRTHDQAFTNSPFKESKNKRFWNPLLAQNTNLQNILSNSVQQDQPENSKFSETWDDSNIKYLSVDCNHSHRVTRGMIWGNSKNNAQRKEQKKKKQKSYLEKLQDLKFRKSLLPLEKLNLSDPQLENLDPKLNKKRTVKEIYINYINSNEELSEFEESEEFEDFFNDDFENSPKKVKIGDDFQVSNLPNWSNVISPDLNYSSLLEKVWDPSVLPKKEVDNYLNLMSQIKCLNNNKTLQEDTALRYLYSNECSVRHTFWEILSRPEGIKNFVLEIKANLI